MKKYSQFLKELPSKSVVFAFGRFNPPTIGHELLVKAVKKLAATNKADHAIYASKSQDAKKNPLSVDKKVHYLNLMFPNTHFVAASTDVPTFIQAAKQLNKKYKNIIMVAGSDRIPEYQRILNTYNGKEFHFDTIQVISAGERDPDADDASGMSASKMRTLASKGDYNGFKKGLPSTMREIDGRRLMNDVRQGMGLDVVKEQINLVKDELREQYFRGEIFNIGDIVESSGVQYEIVKRGSNHLLLKEQTGKLVSKWLQDVTVVEDVQSTQAPLEISFGGYTTKNLHHSADAALAFQDTITRHGKDKPAAVLHALMATDTYMGLGDLHLTQGKQPTETEKDQWVKAHDHAKQHLDELGEFLHHRDYWDNHQHEMEDMLSNYKEEGQSEMNEELTDKTLKTQDKIKVARIIATMLGIDNAETSANPDQLVNSALRKVRSKNLNPEALNILTKMLQLATEVGIKYDNSLVPSKLKESEEINKKSTYNAAKDRLRYKDFAKLSKMNKGEVDHTKVGHSIVGPEHDDHDRRQRVQYQTEEKTIEVTMKSGHKFVAPIKMTHKDWHIVKHPVSGKQYTVDHKGNTIHEEISEETINEISNKLAGNYYAAVVKQHMKVVGGVRHNMYDRMEKDIGKKRKAGVDRALDRITGVKKTNEEVEPMDPVCEDCGQVPCVCDDKQIGANNAKGFDPFFKESAVDMSEYEEDYGNNIGDEEISDEELDAMAAEVNDLDDVIDAYDEHELAIIDADSGEEVEEEPEEKEVNEQVIMEVLSRMERMKAKMRIRRTKAKRERKMQIALKRYSDNKTINKRARRMAVKLMKKRLLRGRDATKISVGEKERIERVIERRKKVVGRLAMRLAPRMRKIEKARMSHSKFTQAAPTVAM